MTSANSFILLFYLKLSHSVYNIQTMKFDFKYRKNLTRREYIYIQKKCSSSKYNLSKKTNIISGTKTCVKKYNGNKQKNGVKASCHRYFWGFYCLVFVWVFFLNIFFSKLSLLTKRKNYELYCIINMNFDFSIILFLQSLDHIIKYSTHTLFMNKFTSMCKIEFSLVTCFFLSISSQDFTL